MNTIDLVEVRIPTFRRAGWLRHALSTLLAQDYRLWKAIVFDDSPTREAETVVKELCDSRIVYHANAKNLGASGNLNQAFQTKPYFNGHYACVLEDDNWLLPRYLEMNVTVLQSSKYKILHRNQQIWSRFAQPPKDKGTTTLSKWYLPGKLSPIHLHAYGLLFPGISNGALFWDTGCFSNLQVCASVKDSTLQECCRCQNIIEPTLFLDDCLAVYADVPLSQTRQPEYTGREHTRFVANLWRQIISKYGKKVIDEAFEISNRVGMRNVLERNLAFIRENRFQRKALTFPQYLDASLRGMASQALITNPIPDYQIPPKDVTCL